ncbi:MAG TPA: SDR family NAD(P)-dependent oxidoreductase [Desulfomonilia bacterium]|nr:SDR family NAD(P)-dependent oxidoreductase [Desulfomonilia bacterium]
MSPGISRLDIRNRVALVTGAAHGIGRATVIKIKGKGGIPVCVDLPSDALDSLAAELGENALVMPCDVTDAAGMREVVAKAVARFGGVDIVVANAGIERIDPSWVMPPEEFEQVLQVNIFGVYRSIRPALPYVMERKGHIVAVSSVSALVPWPLCAAYGASKAFVSSWMRSLRLELAGTGATAGAVYFGYIDTDMMKRSAARQVVVELFDSLPPFGLGMKPREPEFAADKIIRNIESRSAMEFSHLDVKSTFILRGFMHLFDDVTGRLMKMGEVIKRNYGG